MPVVPAAPTMLSGGGAGLLAGVGCSMTWGPAGAVARPAGVLVAGFVGILVSKPSLFRMLG